MPRPTKQLYDWNEQSNKGMGKRIYHGHLFLQQTTLNDEGRAYLSGKIVVRVCLTKMPSCPERFILTANTTPRLPTFVAVLERAGGRLRRCVPRDQIRLVGRRVQRFGEASYPS